MMASGLIFCNNLERLKLTSNNIMAASEAFVCIFTALKQNSLAVNSKDLLYRNEITDEDQPGLSVAWRTA